MGDATSGVRSLLTLSAPGPPADPLLPPCRQTLLCRHIAWAPCPHPGQLPSITTIIDPHTPQGKLMPSPATEGDEMAPSIALCVPCCQAHGSSHSSDMIRCPSLVPLQTPQGSWKSAGGLLEAPLRRRRGWRGRREEKATASHSLFLSHSSFRPVSQVPSR